MSSCVLVSGGSGFIGTWVLHELLAQGTRAVVVDPHPALPRWRRVLGKRASEIAIADATLTDPVSLLKVIEQFQVTHIIHLAALLTPACQADPFLGCQINVLGGTSVWEAARLSNRVKSISYASSYAVYGPETGESETSPNRPPTFYGAFKQAMDLIAEQYWRHFGISSVAVRPHVVYGPERDVGLTAGPSLATKAAARGEGYTIGYTGQVGYDYVEDVAKAFVRAVFECPPGSTVVDLPGEQATTEKFARTIESVVPTVQGKILVDGPAIPANIPPHPQYISRLFPDWQVTSLAEGVRRTVEFYRSPRH